jgi:hypothetical protein
MYTGVQMWRRMACGTAGLVLGAMCFHGAAVLYGAPVLTNARQTHLWAWLMAALVTAPTACVLGLDAKAWRRLYGRCSPSDASELALCIPAHGPHPSREPSPRHRDRFIYTNQEWN